MDKQIDIAGLKVDAITKEQFFVQLEKRIEQGQQTFVTTPYSEFLYNALRDREVMTLLNSSDIAVPDGVGILWAEYFLGQPLTRQNYWLKIIQAWLQVIFTGAQILLRPKKLYQTFPEKIVGADLLWDIAKFAQTKNCSIFLAGGFGDTPQLLKTLLEQRYPGLQIVGASNASPDDPDLQQEIIVAQPDFVLAAFGPIRQERWIARHLKVWPVKMAIGLGGSFDYAVGKKLHPPKFIRAAGLEWLYRLATQPTRAKRIYQASWGLILSLVRYKVLSSMPLRRNGSIVVVNKSHQVLVCRRAEAPVRASRKELHNYWQFPQGGLGKGESIADGAARELREETGIHSATILGVSQFTNSYSWQNSQRNLLRRRHKYSGQEQQTVFFLFTGDDSEIQLDPRELIDYQWVPMDEVTKILAQERVPYATAVLQELAELLKNQ